MSVGKRVAEAVDKMAANDAEAGLFAICAAIDVTAEKEYGKSGKSTYKSFIHDNFGLITGIALGPRVMNLNVHYDHPKVKKNADGLCAVEDILYHAVRCGLYHEAALPANLKFIEKNMIHPDGGTLFLPGSLVHGLIVAVVVSPVNRNESLPSPKVLNFGEFPIPISKLWGRRAELLWLFEVEQEAACLFEKVKQEAKAKPRRTRRVPT